MQHPILDSVAVMCWHRWWAVFAHFTGIEFADSDDPINETEVALAARSAPNACARWVSVWMPNPGWAGARACRTCAQ